MAIEKRASKDGRPAYRVRIAGFHPITGKRQNRTIGTYRTKREAEKAERDALTEQERGTLIDPRKLTVGDLLDQWLIAKTGDVSSNSLNDYETATKLHLKPAFGLVRAQKLTLAHVQEQYEAWGHQYRAYQMELAAWKADMQRWQNSPADGRGPSPTKPGRRGLSPRMVHRCHLVLSQALGRAVRLGILARNVCAEVDKPSLVRSKPTVWTPAETAAFLEVAKTDPLAPLWYLLALEGMRRGEALGLRWSDVNWERGSVHISQTVIADRSNRGAAKIQPRTKTNAGARTVKVTSETLAVLAEHADRLRFRRHTAGDSWQDHDLVLCSSTGTPINPTNVARAYGRLVILSGVPRIRVHDLRHGAASLLLRAGVPAKVVQERLGHASISITMDLYSHVVEGMQDEAAAAMSDVLRRARECG